MQFTLLAAAALATAVSAANIAVDNHCDFDLYLTSAFGSAPNDGVHTLAKSSMDAFTTSVTNDAGEQHALTISKTPDMASPLQNIYNVGGSPQIIYYSLSTIYGDPLAAEGFELDSQGNGFDIKCATRTSGDCPNTYSPSNPNGNNAVFSETDNGDFVLSLC